MKKRAAGGFIDPLIDKGEYIILELQRTVQQFIKSRGLFYTAIRIYEQGEKGKRYKYDLKNIYFICIADFIFDNVDKKKMIHCIKLMDAETGVVFTNLLTFIYIEIPKFTRSLNELETRTDKWLYVLRNLSLLKEIPLNLKGDAVFEEVFEAARIANLNQNDMNAYQREKMIRTDNAEVLRYAKMQGFLEGEKKGKQKGKIEGERASQLKIATNLLKAGIHVSIVQTATGLPLDQIINLKDMLFTGQ
ncbi:MAG: Rpn family recombination-promoting nuclease/putative transposase [Chitinophagaceae bacterium]|nr:Rpn family recombination-promoting nuclease/putative transposase [Chitinophagaceae bacterium]